MSAAADQSVSLVRGWLDDPVHPDWQRPGPTVRQQRMDLLFAVIAAVLCLINLIGSASVGVFGEYRITPVDLIISAALGLVLFRRRRHPILTMLAATVLFIAASAVSQSAAYTLAGQAVYFAAIYVAVAWARNRQALWAAVIAVLLAMVLWVVVDLTQRYALARMLSSLEGKNSGPLGAVPAFLVIFVLLNLCYFGGAVLFGRGAWRAQLQRSLLSEQARIIGVQAQQLTRQAVTEERLRLARELHDSVGHHFTGVGLLAGGARRLLSQAENAEGTGLTRSQMQSLRSSVTQIESSSQSGVRELRTVLRVLRSAEETEGSTDPGLAQIPLLVEQLEASGTAASLEIAVEPARWERLVQDLPVALQLACYRMIQESLTNVSRHAHARQAQVVLRLRVEGTAPGMEVLEVEITDDGAAAPSAEQVAASSGFGLHGIAERAAAYGGEASWGPRVTGQGWAVRFHLPLSVEEDQSQAEFLAERSRVPAGSRRDEREADLP